MRQTYCFLQFSLYGIVHIRMQGLYSLSLLKAETEKQKLNFPLTVKLPPVCFHENQNLIF